MIDWYAAINSCTRMSQRAAAGQLVSATQTLTGWPVESLPDDGDWCYWQRPQRGLRMLGFGAAYAAVGAGLTRFGMLQAALNEMIVGWRFEPTQPLPAAFTGFTFAARGHALWPNARLWVPEVMLRDEAGVCTITFSALAGQVGEAATRWRALWEMIRMPRRIAPASPYREFRHANGTQAFIGRGNAALQAIASGAFEKLVLTRTLRLRSDVPAQPGAVLKALAAANTGCAIYGATYRGQVLVGASPETLLDLHGDQVMVDALAGTAWKDAALALGADKNQREHDLVARAVVAALSGLCTDLELPDAPSEMRLNRLTHLHRRIRGRRRPDVGLFDLVARLHPTPAVGGLPTAEAMDWLRRHGDRRTSWYTGGIGWIDAAGNCDIAVPLRCGVMRGHDAHLFAGAGFVAGSDPEQELAETETKFSAMRDALAACAQSGEPEAA